MSGNPPSLELMSAGMRAALERGRVVDSVHGVYLVAYVVGADERYDRPGLQRWALVGPGGRVRLLEGEKDEAAARQQLRSGLR